MFTAPLRRGAELTAAIAVLSLGLLAATGSGPATAGSGRLVGTSVNGSVSASTKLFPNAKAIRLFFTSDPEVYGGKMASVPSTAEIWVSFRTPIATVKSGAYDAAFAKILKTWNASGRTIKWTWWHEADNPNNHIAPADFVAGWKHLLAVEANNPSSRVQSMTVLESFMLSPNQPHGNPASWYVPGVDLLGFDSYRLQTEAYAIKYAASKGKRLVFPEFGAGIGGSTDAASLTFATAFVAAMTPNVYGACWYNANGNELSTHPRVLAYLKSL